MEKTNILIIVALVIAVVALGLSINSYLAVKKIKAEREEVTSAVEEMKPVVDKIESLMYNLEQLSDLLPRIERVVKGAPAPK